MYDTQCEVMHVNTYLRFGANSLAIIISYILATSESARCITSLICKTFSTTLARKNEFYFFSHF